MPFPKVEFILNIGGEPVLRINSNQLFATSAQTVAKLYYRNYRF